jgi:hypothetical protein
VVVSRSREINNYQLYSVSRLSVRVLNRMGRLWRMRGRVRDMLRNLLRGLGSLSLINKEVWVSYGSILF